MERQTQRHHYANMTAENVYEGIKVMPPKAVTQKKEVGELTVGPESTFFFHWAKPLAASKANCHKKTKAKLEKKRKKMEGNMIM